MIEKTRKTIVVLCVLTTLVSGTLAGFAAFRPDILQQGLDNEHVTTGLNWVDTQLAEQVKTKSRMFRVAELYKTPAAIVAGAALFVTVFCWYLGLPGHLRAARRRIRELEEGRLKDRRALRDLKKELEKQEENAAAKVEEVLVTADLLQTEALQANDMKWQAQLHERESEVRQATLQASQTQDELNIVVAQLGEAEERLELLGDARELEARLEAATQRADEAVEELANERLATEEQRQRVDTLAGEASEAVQEAVVANGQLAELRTVIGIGDEASLVSTVTTLVNASRTTPQAVRDLDTIAELLDIGTDIDEEEESVVVAVMQLHAQKQTLAARVKELEGSQASTSEAIVRKALGVSSDGSVTKAVLELQQKVTSTTTESDTCLVALAATLDCEDRTLDAVMAAITELKERSALLEAVIDTVGAESTADLFEELANYGDDNDDDDDGNDGPSAFEQRVSALLGVDADRTLENAIEALQEDRRLLQQMTEFLQPGQNETAFAALRRSYDEHQAATVRLEHQRTELDAREQEYARQLEALETQASVALLREDSLQAREDAIGRALESMSETASALEGQFGDRLNDLNGVASELQEGRSRLFRQLNTPNGNGSAPPDADADTAVPNANGSSASSDADEHDTFGAGIHQ